MRRPTTSAGFTLIEVVLTMIVISVGLLSLTRLFSENVKALDINEDSQLVTQYAQECAERVLARRRDFGFSDAGINSSMCNTTLPAGIATVVTVPATYAGSSGAACPIGFTCRNITVTTSKGTISSVITLMLIDY